MSFSQLLNFCLLLFLQVFQLCFKPFVAIFEVIVFEVDFFEVSLQLLDVLLQAGDGDPELSDCALVFGSFLLPFFDQESQLDHCVL